LLEDLLATKKDIVYDADDLIYFFTWESAM